MGLKWENQNEMSNQEIRYNIIGYQKKAILSNWMGLIPEQNLLKTLLFVVTSSKFTENLTIWSEMACTEIYIL